jgi:hypothetical protein
MVTFKEMLDDILDKSYRIAILEEVCDHLTMFVESDVDEPSRTLSISVLQAELPLDVPTSAVSVFLSDIRVELDRLYGEVVELESGEVEDGTK